MNANKHGGPAIGCLQYTDGGPRQNASVNEAFIVLACNSHYELTAERDRLKDSNKELLEACKSQQAALDDLFARLITIDPAFMPTLSGQPWEAVIQGVAVIEKAIKGFD